MNFSNKVMLVTYADSIGGNLKELENILCTHFKSAIGGLHILPFFPSSGDRGFSPTTYKVVDPAFGNWNDIKNLQKKYYLMCDVMVNHISKRSEEFMDYMEKSSSSKYEKLFLNYDDFWGVGRPTQKDIDLLYRRKDGEPFQLFKLNDGTEKKLWCTFTQEQIDIDTRSQIAKEYIKETFESLKARGFSIIRLDAAGYVTKQKDTNCFMVEPYFGKFIDEMKAIAGTDLMLLPEIHDTWHIAKKLEAGGNWSYDFVLPFLMLNSLYTNSCEKLSQWLKTAPSTQFTVLDTHDGIGVYDAFDWVNETEAEELIKKIEGKLSYSFKPLNPEKLKFKKAYQLYATYFSALHEDENAYLLARAVQFFAPGVPQVYYVGLLAGENDYESLSQLDDHRSINRHNYSCEEIALNTQRPVVKKLIKMMQFRNNYDAFSHDIAVSTPSSTQLIIERRNKDNIAKLNCNFQNKTFNITYKDEDGFIKELPLT